MGCWTSCEVGVEEVRASTSDLRLETVEHTCCGEWWAAAMCEICEMWTIAWSDSDGKGPGGALVDCLVVGIGSGSAESGMDMGNWAGMGVDNGLDDNWVDIGNMMKGTCLYIDDTISSDWVGVKNLVGERNNDARNGNSSNSDGRNGDNRNCDDGNDNSRTNDSSSDERNDDNGNGDNRNRGDGTLIGSCPSDYTSV